MKLLAWDTSSKAGTLVALEWHPDRCKGIQDVRLVAEMSLNVDSTHSERLLWGIHQILESARWNLNDVDVFGVGLGPGSFTGLRIGLTTARTLAQIQNKPLVGVSSLAALIRPLALHYSQDNFQFETVLIAATDACKGEIFALWGSPRSVLGCVVKEEGMPGLWSPEVEEQVIEPSVLISSIRKKLAEGSQNTRWIAVGEGRQRYLSDWNQLGSHLELQVPFPHSHHVQGRYLGALVWEAFEAGLARDALSVHPRYLRASDAELKLKAGLLGSGPTRGIT